MYFGVEITTTQLYTYIIIGPAWLFVRSHYIQVRARIRTAFPGQTAFSRQRPAVLAQVLDTGNSARWLPDGQEVVGAEPPPRNPVRRGEQYLLVRFRRRRRLRYQTFSNASPVRRRTRRS